MRVRIQDEKGAYMVFETLFPIKTVPNPQLNEVIITCEEWIVAEFSKPMWETIQGPTKQQTTQE